VALNVGYFWTSWKNFRATDNLLVTPSDYDPYCITAPVDARLPGGGGNQICGLYDITPTKFGLQNNLVTSASNFGNQKEIYNGVDATINARLGRGAFVGGGLSTGRTATNTCFVPSTQALAGFVSVVDSPQALRPGFCDITPPFSANTQVKLNAAFPLPWNFQVSGVFQNLPGIPITASSVVSTADVARSLGRPLAGSLASVTVDLIPPQTMFEDRVNQLDVRFTRRVTVGRARLEGNLDVYNIFNGSSILATNGRYGSAWLTPTQVLGGRLAKVGVQLSF
jgi:hypothetical protein